MAFSHRSNTSSWPGSSSTSLGSPPSLTYSDIDSESTEDIMDNPPLAGEDASAVMAQVLGCLDKVVEHLRCNEEFEAANDMAKSAISMVTTFNNATAAWDIEKHMMPAPPTQKLIKAAGEMGASATDGNAHISTWAAVAATAAGPDNRLIKFRPHDGIKLRVDQGIPISSDPDMRVVWVQGWAKGRSLAEISDSISYGALFSMAFVEDHAAVCVIFYQAEGARHFLDAENAHVRRSRFGQFGPQCHLVQGQAFPVDKDLSLMSPPANERRRLTFARSQLFVGELTAQRFKKDICELVGENNVELVWLFNTGNATVVCSGTLIARLIRDEFRRRSRQRGPYRDVQVTFSHDPCERALNLITQIPGMQDARPRLDSYPPRAIDSYRPGGHANNARNGGRRGSSVSGRPVIDADGWQTVARRR